MPENTYDYIVIGAGAAGCALAARLAESREHSVLLLEAGRDDSWHWLKIPLGVGIVLTGERALWRYYTEPEPGFANRKVFWPRGRVLGGTSSINGMLWVRGDPAEYDHWANLGNEGWSYAELLPVFRSIESTSLGSDDYRGRKGPVNVVEHGPTDPLTQGFLDASAAAGIPRTADYNGLNYAGGGLLQLNTRCGLRHGAREAYLQGAKRSPTLTVMTDAHAESLQIRNGRVEAVRVRRDNVSMTFRARYEIALCAGAIGSPQLLELSGIGDSSLLPERGIGCHHHLPGVGEGLRDHVHTRLSFRCNRRGTLNDILANPVRKALFAARYAIFRNGLMAGSTSTAHVLTRSLPELARPDLKLQMHLLSAGDTRDPDKISFDPFPGFGIGSFALRPQSTGSVHVVSPDLRAPPRICANYLSAAQDLRCAIAGVRLARLLARQPALAQFIDAETRPGPGHDDDESIAGFISETASTSYHPVGTCRMGSDKGAVVDHRLRVRGLRGLRIADASVFPTMPSANTHAPSILVGEMAARFMQQLR